MSRDVALSWWRGLSLQEQKNLVDKHFPTKDFILISTSSSRIEEIWEKEQNNN
jgi:hypothetical protein